MNVNKKPILNATMNETNPMKTYLAQVNE